MIGLTVRIHLPNSTQLRPTLKTQLRPTLKTQLRPTLKTQLRPTLKTQLRPTLKTRPDYLKNFNIIFVFLLHAIKTMNLCKIM